MVGDKMHKKYILLIAILMASFFAFNYQVNADYKAKYIAQGKCKLKSASTGDCYYADNGGKPNYSKLGGTYWLDDGDDITVIESKAPVKAPTSGNGSECKTTYSYFSIVYNGTTFKGWACTANIRNITTTDWIPADLKNTFKAQGFPDSYWPHLAVMKEVHPNWNFVAINTGLTFDAAVKGENKGKKSLIYSNSASTQGYLSTSETNYNWQTDTFTPWDGKKWFAANYDTIAYYMDPRNFLSDTYIFQFETLSYNPTFQTLEAVKNVLGSAYISQYADHFMTAATKENINPVYLAALSIQEVGAGTTPNITVSGNSFTYNKKNYPAGYYNFFNIGANSGSDGESAIRALVYAYGGEDGKDTSSGRPWTSPEKAIVGGAKWISDGYIQAGQDTSYFKKYNTIEKYLTGLGKTANSNYTHQYQQNIVAPSSEAVKSHTSYKKANLIDAPFTFNIPVYSSMPTATALPKTGNPNNYLKTLTYNDGSGAKTVVGFSGDKTSYSFSVLNSVSSVTFAATTINANAKVSGVGAKSLNVGDNQVSIVVTAQNGAKKTYTINVKREAPTGPSKAISDIVKNTNINLDGDYVNGLTLTTKASDFINKIKAYEPQATVTIKRGSKVLTSEYLATGDTITITSGSDAYTYTALIYGDASGDSKINALDLLQVQKYILGDAKLSGAYLKACDVNKDGRVTAFDLLQVQKHILGDTTISQL